jgi:ADP-ribose pyrophosphatase
MKIERPKSKQSLPEDAKRVFKGVIFDVYQWEQELYDGTKTVFEKLKRPDSALVIPVTTEGKIIMSYQEQPRKTPFIGFIGGRIDEGEGPLEAGKRELLEEAGYEASDWSLLEAFQPVSKIEWAVFILVAKGCRKVAEQNLEGGEKIDLKLVDFDELVDIIINEKDSRFRDAELRVKFLETKLDPKKMDELRELIVG